MNGKMGHPGDINMPQFPNPQIVKKVKKLSEVAEELRQGKDFPVTRLTTIKGLCEGPEAAAAFALFLAQRMAWFNSRSQLRGG